MSSRRSRNRSRKPAAAAVSDTSSFWGDPEAVPDLEIRINPNNDPTAMIRSLGKPPFVFNNENAERHFAVVYGRATMLASALAAASGLFDDDAH